jgi:hypothetical protein
MRTTIGIAGLAVVAITLSLIHFAPSKAPVRSSAEQSVTLPTFTGEIMDSACAALGSHDATMGKYGFKTSKDCVLDCLNSNATLVLYDSATQTTYKLDDQDKPKQFIGQRVSVAGSYDESAHVIHIQSIQAAQQ